MAVIVFILFYAGCDNVNAPDCFKTTGQTIRKEIALDSFSSIQVMDEVDIYLSNSIQQKVIVETGENLLGGIKVEVNNHLLTIENDNSCNWHRAPGNPRLYIYAEEIREIGIYDYANVYTLDTLGQERLQIYSDGTGNFEMTVNLDSLFIESIYISNFKFAGITKYLFIHFNNDSRFMGSTIVSDRCQILHEGSNRMEVYPVTSLTGEMNSTGSLYYFNKPQILDVKVNGTGEIIDQSTF